jgi:hemolysin III
VPFVAFFATIPAVTWLYGATSARARPIAIIYGLGLLALFGISALYHRKTWRRGGYELMRRVDHLTIFVFIAASYTPIGTFGVGGSRGEWMVRSTWLFALLGAAQTLFWHRAPRSLRVGLYLAMGWSGLVAVTPLWHRVGPIAPAMLMLGGLMYTTGAIIYARKSPDPVPRVFGYHEVFHSLVVVACGCLFVCIWRCLGQA